MHKDYLGGRGLPWAWDEPMVILTGLSPSGLDGFPSFSIKQSPRQVFRGAFQHTHEL